MASEISGLDPLHAYLEIRKSRRADARSVSGTCRPARRVHRAAGNANAPSSIPAAGKAVPELPVSPPHPKNPPANEQGLFFE